MKLGNLTTLILLAFSSILSFSSLSATESPPVELFFKNPQYKNFSISPEGDALAVLADLEGVMNIVVIDLADPKPQFITNEKRDVSSFHWLNNDRIMFSMNSFLFDRKSQKTAGGIFAVNRDGSKYKVLEYPFGQAGKGGNSNTQKNLPIMLRYLGDDPSDEDYVFATFNDRRVDHPDLYRLNIKNGRRNIVKMNPGRINGYMMDPKGNIRGGIEYTDEAVMRYHIRDVETDEWKFVDEFEWDYKAWNIAGYDLAKDMMLVTSNHKTDTKALYRYNPKTLTFSDKPLFHDPDYDLDDLEIVKTREKPSRIRAIYYNKDVPAVIPFEKKFAEIQAMLNQAIPDGFNKIMSFDEDESTAIVENISDIHPPRYFIFRIKERKLETLGTTYPWLDNIKLVPNKPIKFTSRDGLEIEGYLTLPTNYAPGKPVPLIVNPHGGPWARDKWGIQWWLDLEKQYLASRGFAVMQINFRGSTGYGKKHYEAHIKNMEGMHNDLMDGIQWAIDKGYADKDVIGIMGASWGGYATMTALAKEPDVFKFGVNIFGVVDLAEQIYTYRDDWNRESGYHHWVRCAGDPGIEEERAYLDEWSAINYIEDIEAPVFIYHGIRDFNVDVEQSRMLESALKKHDKEFEIIYRKDEAHSSFRESDRIELYKAIDKFLKPFAPIK